MKTVYIVCSTFDEALGSNEQGIDSVWTSERKAHKRRDELNSTASDSDMWVVSVWEVSA